MRAQHSDMNFLTTKSINWRRKSSPEMTIDQSVPITDVLALSQREQNKINKISFKDIQADAFKQALKNESCDIKENVSKLVKVVM